MAGWSKEEAELVTEFINNFNVMNGAVEDTNAGDASIKTIDWDYWAGLQNITPHQTAKLVQLIDPILWQGNTYSLGALPDDMEERITRITQQLASRSQLWSLTSLVAAIGEENVPLRMVQAIKSETQQPETATGGADRERTNQPPAEPKPEAVKAWKDDARTIGEAWMNAERDKGGNPGVIAIARHVEGELSSRSITGARGKFLDWETIKREALKGITGRPPNGKRQKS